VIADPELRKRVGAGGQALIEEKFSMASVTARYIELYQRAISESTLPDRRPQ
jgi:glycosyltransferase involved in cell wall biosynthesis